MRSRPGLCSHLATRSGLGTVLLTSPRAFFKLWNTVSQIVKLSQVVKISQLVKSSNCETQFHNLRICVSQFEKMLMVRLVWLFRGRIKSPSGSIAQGPRPAPHRPFQLRDLSYFEIIYRNSQFVFTISQVRHKFSNNFGDIKMHESQANSKNGCATALARQEFYLIPYSVFGWAQSPWRNSCSKFPNIFTISQLQPIRVWKMMIAESDPSTKIFWSLLVIVLQVGADRAVVGSPQVS